MTSCSMGECPRHVAAGCTRSDFAFGACARLVSARAERKRNHIEARAKERAAQHQAEKEEKVDWKVLQTWVTLRKVHC